MELRVGRGKEHLLNTVLIKKENQGLDPVSTLEKYISE